MNCQLLSRNGYMSIQPVKVYNSNDDIAECCFVYGQMEELKEGLDLSDDQEKQVREIITAGSETMRKAREEMQDDGGDFEGMREKMQQMREEQTEKIKAVLTEEQFTKYEQIQAERRKRMRQGGGGFGGDR